MISEELKAGLAQWLAWAENGAPEGDPFYRDIGLCSNMWDLDANLGIELHDVLEDEFGDNCEYPFGQHDYDKRQDDGTLHECPNRLAWVRKVVGADA